MTLLVSLNSGTACESMSLYCTTPLLSRTTVTTPRATFTFLIGGGAQPHRIGTDGNLVANNVTYALAGAQYWLTGSVWVSVGAGGGTFHCNQCIDKDAMIPKDTKHAGIASATEMGLVANA